MSATQFPPEAGTTRRWEMYAHRGGAGEVPENSRSAVEHVRELGLGWMETDVRVTSDGVVVLAHDADLRRIDGDRTPISRMSWTELADHDYGDGLPAVRFEEALADFPRLHFNVDLKDDDVARPAVEVVARLDAWDRVRFASFSSARLRTVRRCWPRARTSLGMTDVARLVVAARLGERAVLHFGQSLGVGVDAVQVPVAMWGMPVVTRAFVQAAHDLGLEVHVWTVNELEEMERLARLGVDGIVTDYPSRAREAL